MAYSKGKYSQKKSSKMAKRGAVKGRGGMRKGK